LSRATAIRWRATYLEVAERLRAGAPAARPVLAASNACVDRVFHVDAARLARLAAAGDSDGIGAELAVRVLARITAGRGGELLTRWSGGPDWIMAVLGQPDRHQIGGSGPQASWTLATVGAPSVLALGDRSAEQLAVIDPRTGICADGVVVPAGSLVASGTPTKLPHCVLEFTAGTRCGALAVPRASRIILRFGDEPIERDEEFFRMAPALAVDAGAALLSGLNSLPDDGTDDRQWLAALSRLWSHSGLSVIHHELGEFSTLARLRQAAALGLGTSLGLSLSELFMLTGGRGDPCQLAHQVATQYDAHRVIVHADHWALAVHRSDPKHQESVLLAGNAFAAARARNGEPAAALGPAEDATYTDDLPPSDALDEGWQATCVPAPHLRQPKGTIGLGDTFTAGVLLAEGLPL
jgi:ADP-specific Phosphofructokinase/Glucokinase conserved region